MSLTGAIRRSARSSRPLPSAIAWSATTGPARALVASAGCPFATRRGGLRARSDRRSQAESLCVVWHIVRRTRCRLDCRRAARCSHTARFVRHVNHLARRIIACHLTQCAASRPAMSTYMARSVSREAWMSDFNKCGCTSNSLRTAYRPPNGGDCCARSNTAALSCKPCATV